MKKFITILLTVAMLFACSLNAFAEGHFIGGKTGVATFEPNSTSTGNIEMGIGSVANRYAVDVVFPTMTFEIGGVTWDVNNHKYVADNGTTVGDKQWTISVTNHSDKAVNAKAALSDGANVSLISGTGISISLSNAAAFEVGDAKGGTEKTEKITVDVKSSSWADDIVKILAAANGTSTAVLKTVTLTISKDNIT